LIGAFVFATTRFTVPEYRLYHRVAKVQHIWDIHIIYKHKYHFAVYASSYWIYSAYFFNLYA
jgi:hypothetical protein